MAATIPSTEPTKIRTGDSLAWTKSLSEYPASDGWTLTYYLRAAAGAAISFAAAASGADYAIARTAAQTASWTASRYTWVAVVTKDDERFTVDTGTFDMLPDLATGTNYDGRSFARKMVDAIEAALVSSATADELDLLEVHVYSRAQKRDRSALITARSKFLAEAIRDEQAAGNAKSGRLLVRM